MWQIFITWRYLIILSAKCFHCLYDLRATQRRLASFWQVWLEQCVSNSLTFVPRRRKSGGQIWNDDGTCWAAGDSHPSFSEYWRAQCFAWKRCPYDHRLFFANRLWFKHSLCWRMLLPTRLDTILLASYLQWSTDFWTNIWPLFIVTNRYAKGCFEKKRTEGHVPYLKTLLCTVLMSKCSAKMSGKVLNLFFSFCQVTPAAHASCAIKDITGMNSDHTLVIAKSAIVTGIVMNVLVALFRKMNVSTILWVNNDY